VVSAGTSLRVLAASGLLRPVSPFRLANTAGALRHWGVNLAGGVAATAARRPDRPAVIDGRGTLTWAALDRQSDALAEALRAQGAGEGQTVGLLARNHRGFVLAITALAKAGAHVLLANTGFAGPQLREVLAREHAVALLCDSDFLPLLNGEMSVPVVLTDEPDDEVSSETVEGRAALSHPSLEDLVPLAFTGAAGSSGAPGRNRPAAAERAGRVVILTSGTTGTPKGASRPQTAGVDAAVAMLERIPYREGDITVMAAPLFHAWGFANLGLGTLLGAGMVLRPRFDPEQVLADIAHHRARVLVAVPVMLQRILALPDVVRRRHDTSSLQVVASSGSALPAGFATRWMDAFGDNLYSLYGSTEVGWATIATPADLRADPATAGRPPLNTVVRVLDDDGQPVPVGETGRIFVGNELLFDGYTDGNSKQVIDGLMSTGDVGRLDANGRLRVDGRDDDMIVSGGENVYPREVEELLEQLDGVLETAVVGVTDDEFGQRLRAVVVAADGSGLDADAVRAHVAANLARYKVPRDVVFIAELPRNATGKVLKRQLAE
jgi:acyl-CoA synthetase (AMP-forming)/AMP-acid ligase II